MLRYVSVDSLFWYYKINSALFAVKNYQFLLSKYLWIWFIVNFFYFTAKKLFLFIFFLIYMKWQVSKSKNCLLLVWKKTKTLRWNQKNGSLFPNNDKAPFLHTCHSHIFIPSFQFYWCFFFLISTIICSFFNRKAFININFLLNHIPSVV